MDHSLKRLVTFTVRTPSLVNLLTSVCHCLKAMVGRMMRVDARIAVYEA